jgi:hypothetical protein
MVIGEGLPDIGSSKNKIARTRRKMKIKLNKSIANSNQLRVSLKKFLG